MQIPPAIRKCVGFLGCNRNGCVEVRGTFWLTTYPVENTSYRTTYAVTARHVIDRLSELSNDGQIHLKINSKTAAVTGTIEQSLWRYNDDPRVDVAVAPLELDSSWDQIPIPSDMFVTEEVIAHELIGPGDDLFFPGLFTRHPGELFNIPIMRTGTIAAMPEEPINMQTGMQRAYLVEARSIGGLSGSPVFVHTGFYRQFADGNGEF